MEKTDAEATIKHSIIMGLSEHGGKKIIAENGDEIAESIIEHLFCSSTIWAVKDYLNEEEL